MSTKESAIQLKLEYANSTLGEAKLLMQGKFYNGAVSRMYYACYHATLALLLTKDLTPKTHSGVATLLHEYFVRQYNFDTKKSAFFTLLMQQREKDDYNDFLIVDKSMIEKYITPAEDYIAYIITLLT